MKDAGVWDTQRPPDSAFQNMGAFGINTMPFTDWLRWVFVPNVERLITSNGPWPTSSQVSAQAAYISSPRERRTLTSLTRGLSRPENGLADAARNASIKAS
jgi:uncharacterized protein YqcC (DUF446 family)